MIPSILLLWFAAAAATQDTAIQEALETVAESARALVPAKQIERPAPRYPRQELRDGKQAWVHVAYCIDESGATQNVSVLDSVGSAKFEKAAVETVKQWRYEPALIDGEPSWQSRNETLINFAIEKGNTGASKRFAKQFRKIGDLIDQEKLSDADELFWRVYDSENLSLYELSKLWAQRVRYEGLSGDMYKLDMALRRATASDGAWIEPESYIRLLKLRAQVELQIGQYHAARQSFDELVKAAGNEADEVLALEPVMGRLHDLIASEDIMRVEGKIRSREECIGCDQSWLFTPVRNDFTFTNISGELEMIEMRCDHKRYESAISELVEWHIPEAWGTCRVHVYGELGTTFDVLQLPGT